MKTGKQKELPELVDNQWYRRAYPDVSASGMDPEVHYMRYGKAMGRRGNPDGGVELKLPSPNLLRRSKRHGGVASIPGRVDSLKTAINSISSQLDEIYIYLNGFSETPSFLRGISNFHVFSSEEHDDIGDAGKFFALKTIADGLYFSFDDDIIYPSDYAERLSEAAENYGCPVGVHGKILNRTAPTYYRSGGRGQLHFKDKLAFDTPVDILGTGTLCFDTHKHPLDISFDYRNMADLWVARGFRSNDTPLVSIARPFEWLKPIEGSNKSIWSDHNAKQTVQSILVERMSVEISTLNRPKLKALPRIFIGVKTFNRVDYLKSCIHSLLKTLEGGFEYILAIADDGSSDGTIEYMKNLRISLDLELMYNDRRYAPGQFNELVRRAMDLKSDFIFILDDDVVFKKPGWVSAYFNAGMNSGYEHLCHYNIPHHAQLAARRGVPLDPPEIEASSYNLSAYTAVENCMGALMTLTPRVVEKVGYADETNFFVRGLWHVDYSARACRAGFNEASRFFDLRDANDFLLLQNSIAGEYRSSISWESDEFKRSSTQNEKGRRKSIVGIRDRIFSSAKPQFIKIEETYRRDLDVNTFFDQVFVLNLDRRKDRLAKITRRLENLGIAFTRFRAYDGQSENISHEYGAYAESVPKNAESRIKDSLSYHQGKHTLAEQARYHLARSGLPAIRSPGAWAYLRGYREMLSSALENRFKSILILDDDCIFHKDFVSIFAKAAEQIPARWRTMHLGTMQFNWERTETYSENLYMPHGFIVGSHAVGYNAPAIPAILNRIDMMCLPYDVGPLQQDAMHHRDHTFVVRPNIAIQDDLGSDINSSDVAPTELKSAENKYRWQLKDYIA